MYGHSKVQKAFSHLTIDEGIKKRSNLSPRLTDANKFKHTRDGRNVGCKLGGGYCDLIQTQEHVFNCNSQHFGKLFGCYLPSTGPTDKGLGCAFVYLRAVLRRMHNLSSISIEEISMYTEDPDGERLFFASSKRLESNISFFCNI